MNDDRVEVWALAQKIWDGMVEHPVWSKPEVDEIVWVLKGENGLEVMAQYVAERGKKLELEASDALRNGYCPPIWGLVDDLLCEGKMVVLDVERLYPRGGSWADKRLAGGEFERRLRSMIPREVRTSGATEIFLTGGNRPGKSMYCARRLVKDQVDNRGHGWWCGSETNESSIGTQQKLVQYYLPAEWRNQRDKHGRYNTKFTEKQGFTDNKYVLPNGSWVLFKNYAQDEGTLEGPKLHGVWLDELVPLSWIKTLRMRLIDYNGVLLVSFTPIRGYTPSVAEFVEGATDLLEIPAVKHPETLGPKVQRSKTGGHVVYFQPYLDNPYMNHVAFDKRLQGQPRSWVLERTEGWVNRKMGVILTKFRKGVHTVAPSEIPKEGTRYMVVDPGKGKPWVAKWYLVTPGKRRRIYLYREWPCPALYVPALGYVGPWAVSGARADGMPGPGQDPIGWGLDRYVGEFLRLESGVPLLGLSDVPGRGVDAPEVILERIMDSRAMNEAMHRRGESNTSLGDEMADAGMVFTEASGLSVDDGIELLLRVMDWDVNAGVSRENCPDFYVNEECENSIMAYEVWTNVDEGKGAVKDFVDPDRYLLLANPIYVDPKRKRVSGGKYW